VKEGDNADLNDIDVNEITDMCSLFRYKAFNGNISEWNVSNVTDMTAMFYNSAFNGDLSSWDVSNVKHMSWMFGYSDFDNASISNWNVTCNTFMGMLTKTSLEKNPPKWYIG
jgi:surface protein